MAKAKTTDAAAKKPSRAKKSETRPTLDQLQKEISAKAHQIYHERASRGEPGDNLSDWLRAEALIKSIYNL